MNLSYHLHRGVGHLPPSGLIIGSALSQYMGAALAISLFHAMHPASVAWCRVTVAAVILVAWRRPWQSGITWADFARSTLFGITILTMNAAFYQALVTLPLGAAVSLEFVGPVAVAVLSGRGWSVRVAALLACVGVACIGGLGVDTGDPAVISGLLWAGLSGLSWACYIVLGRKIAAKRSAVTNLALGCAGACLVYAPFLGSGAGVAFYDVSLLLSVILVGVLSTALPFTLEAVAMTRLSASTFSLLAALEPATSAVIGAFLLRQVPTIGQLVGLVCISVAVWLASRQDVPSGQSSSSGTEV
ncbi:EamA family transporter [Schaalia sp. lx-260]|uniref:EamA family transporter n=1 Tax=Schaalia sp. lx-260 TaxID=2899082 RepID=UPI002F2B5568